MKKDVPEDGDYVVHSELTDEQLEKIKAVLGD